MPYPWGLLKLNSANMALKFFGALKITVQSRLPVPWLSKESDHNGEKKTENHDLALTPNAMSRSLELLLDSQMLATPTSQNKEAVQTNRDTLLK